MSFLRSMCISLCNALKLKSISDAIHNLEKSTSLLGQFLRMAAVTNPSQNPQALGSTTLTPEFVRIDHYSYL
jgi:hypothetical protein